MKNKLQLSLMLLAFTIGSTTAQLAHFPFDENAIDANQEINSTAESAGIDFVQDNYRGSVLAMDGTNGFITYPSNDVYNFDALTYNLWFRWTTAVADQWWVRIFDFGLPSDMPDHPGNHDVVFLTLYQEGVLSWHIHSVDWTDGSDTILTSLEPIVVGDWYMLTCTHDADSARLYLNGVLQGSKSVNGVKPSDLNFLNMYLGKSNWPDALFQGKLDEFTIWDEVLTQEAITALYVFPDVPTGTADRVDQGISIHAWDQHLVVSIDNALPTASLKVYNLQGIEVRRETGFGNQLEISNLKAGIYIVQVVNGSNTSTRKVLIQ